MNGLKLIRTQCNISLNRLAETLGVTRQVISVWEHGKKEIPVARLEQLSEYFGIEKEFFGEITEAQKQTILNKTMFMWGEGTEGYLLYRCSNKYMGLKFRNKERECSHSEEFLHKKHIQKELLSQINHQITGLVQSHLLNQLKSVNRGLYYYNFCFDNMRLIDSKASAKKMSYFYRLIEVMKAVSIAFDGECELPKEKDYYWYAENPVFIKELAEYIKNYMDPLMDGIDRK